MSKKTKILWNDIDWNLVEKRVMRIQKRIYKHSLAKDKGRVTMLQNLLISSLDAKLLAIRRVTTDNSGKNTAGVDKLIYTTPEQKAQLVSQMEIDGKAAPIRRVWIPKPGKSEKRPLGIPIIKDRAKQKLVLMALEPEWEARFEANSYGFRPGRSAMDAMEAIFLILRNKDNESQVHKYVMDADLKGCFDNIDHEYLLNKLDTSPKIRTQIQAWLKAGIFEGLTLNPPYDEVAPNEIGTPQGGIISPFLANVALHGMENHLEEWIVKQKWPYSKRHEGYTANKIKSIGFVRYADDFVVFHKDKRIVQLAKEELQNWLNTTSKLKFNEDKTQIKDTRNGFNFLGFSVIHLTKDGYTKLKIYPSKKNQVKLIKTIGDFCRKHRALSVYDLVKALRPKTLGWANYFKYSECKEVFSKMDRLIFSILRAWVFRRDRRNGRKVIKEKYFPIGKTYVFNNREYQNNWILNGSKKEKGGELVEIHLPKISWVASVKHQKVLGTSSIYDNNTKYWAMRNFKYSSFNTRETKLLRLQKGICPLCKCEIKDTNVQVDHIVPKAQGGKDVYKNLQLVHTYCHVRKTKAERRPLNT